MVLQLNQEEHKELVVQVEAQVGKLEVAENLLLEVAENLLLEVAEKLQVVEELLLEVVVEEADLLVEED